MVGLTPQTSPASLPTRRPRDLLTRLRRTAQARAGFERAASLTRNEREQELLLRRAAEQQ
ncbi:hypothetical protein ABZ281_21265 [Streptomyces sp. NPDC006265]|uniref:hypothetical protein n=1 Tax=Streptomyces sp. NPDC006265 TaxID=3156740 RepID=UPI0033A5B58D